MNEAQTEPEMKNSSGKSSPIGKCPACNGIGIQQSNLE
jgi:excinuclease UvrABC ATPase subunit